MIPYGRQSIGEDDIAAVMEALRSDWLTQGPRITQFEEALADYTGATYAVVVSNGTAALHAAFFAIGIESGDEFITTPITFPATANAGLWQGAKPVFVDVDPITGNIDPTKIEAAITPKTKAIVPVDYTGRPADLRAIQAIAQKHHLVVIEDGAQSLGAAYHGKKIGSVSDLTTFSFHPVKSITTAEGGAIMTNNEKYYRRMKQFITHGVTKENLTIPSPGEWYFEQQLLGLNYRLTDIQAALGMSQLKKLDGFVAKRRALVERYNEAFSTIETIRTPLLDTPEILSAWHLYVVSLQKYAATRRAEIFCELRNKGIGVQVHHIPVHYHPYYQSLGYTKGMYPNAEGLYESILSLPLYPDLTHEEQDQVIDALKAVTV